MLQRWASMLLKTAIRFCWSTPACPENVPTNAFLAPVKGLLLFCLFVWVRLLWFGIQFNTCSHWNQFKAGVPISICPYGILA